MGWGGQGEERSSSRLGSCEAPCGTPGFQCQPSHDQLHAAGVLLTSLGLNFLIYKVGIRVTKMAQLLPGTVVKPSASAHSSKQPFEVCPVTIYDNVIILVVF